MDMELKEKFLSGWKKYFGEVELPIVCWFGNDKGTAAKAATPKGWSCLIADLARVRRGESLSFGKEAVACGGARRYLGYAEQIRPKFEYFLSCGIPNEMEGERYKRTPEIVLETQKHLAHLPADDRPLVFKRWDNLVDRDDPEIVIFFAKPDVLSGLFTLANFDRVEPNGVFCPFAPGCGSIVHFPWLEMNAESPRAVIGMFDVSARPCVPAGTLTFAVPLGLFAKMVGCMDESFLITGSWDKVRRRIGKE
ncbi:MAG: hypothetical protein EPN93_14225 [Spirochaetes bacterium]|nr:MAG: hypothetical protein EPN93_14225 [Spirochaetota bacterium]